MTPSLPPRNRNSSLLPRLGTKHLPAWTPSGLWVNMSYK